MPQAQETDVLDAETDLEDEQTDEEQGADTEAEGDEPKEEEAEATSEAEADEEEPEEVVVSLGDEPADTGADPGTETTQFRELRKQYRQVVRQLREAEGKLKAAPSKTEPVEDIGPEPDIGDADIDYDKEVFKKRWTEWSAKKQANEDRKREQQKAEQKAQEAYQARLDTYRKQAADLKVKDFEDAEAEARDIFSPVQQSILVKYAATPATLIYALGKSTAKAKELAAITDPIEFALAAARLEEKHLKVTPRKTAPPPERVIGGSKPGSLQTNARLEALKTKAQKTGDYSEYFAAKRKMADK